MVVWFACVGSEDLSGHYSFISSSHECTTGIAGNKKDTSTLHIMDDQLILAKSDDCLRQRSIDTVLIDSSKYGSPVFYIQYTHMPCTPCRGVNLDTEAKDLHFP